MITSFMLALTLVFISILYEHIYVHRQRIILIENLSRRQIGKTTNNKCFVLLKVYQERPNERTNSSRMFVIYMKISTLHFRTFRNNDDASGMIFLSATSVFSNLCKVSHIIFSSSFSRAILACIENVAKIKLLFQIIRRGNRRVHNSFIHLITYSPRNSYIMIYV